MTIDAPVRCSLQWPACRPGGGEGLLSPADRWLEKAESVANGEKGL